MDKGFSELPDDAYEQLALQTYFHQLDQPQVAFSVKQERPTMLNEAVAAAIEIQSYLLAQATVAGS